MITNRLKLVDFLKNFHFDDKPRDLFSVNLVSNSVAFDSFAVSDREYPKYVGEFWTSKQRQSNSLHEIAYRACFKSQLPNFFINLFTKIGDIVHDPFSGRGTTAIEAGLLDRNVIANDINPLSRILSQPRFFVPKIIDLQNKLSKIPVKNLKADIDLSMFYHSRTESEIVSLRKYFLNKTKNSLDDDLDRWIMMVATNRLTGHSPGFFSVYTLPPNQAVSPESQLKINKKRNQKPEYRNIKDIILKKTLSLIKGLSKEQQDKLNKIGSKAKFLDKDARYTKEIRNNSVQLTVTSPPFLDIVQYSKDNWLRCWFNGLDSNIIAKKITMTPKIEEWAKVMGEVFQELFRVTKHGGWVAFEVGEVRKGEIRLDEYVIPLGVTVGFSCEGIIINQQKFTKTANIWGINNNTGGTNSNRIVLFHKK